MPRANRTKGAAIDGSGTSGGARTEVLIVGAGPTGLLLACELRRRDIGCTLVDELDAPQNWDRATVIHPRSLEIFDALGLADRFLDEGVRIRMARFESEDGILGELDLALTGSRYGFDLGLSEETTERLLAGYLESVGGSVTRSTRVIGSDQGPDGVTVTVERDGTRFDIEADWLVGCDGLHSVVREQAGIAFPGTDIDAAWAVFDAAIAGWKREFDVVAALLDAPPVIMTPLPGRRWRVYMRPISPAGDLVAEASEVLHRYAPEAEFTDAANPARFHCHSRVATSYRSGRVLLAGDAAHVCSPAEGHGMNTGIQDAFNLGWKLALVCRGAASDALLDTYEIERRPVAERVVTSGRDTEAGHSLTDPAARQERDAGMRSIFGDPESSHHEAAASAELDRSYADSPIVIGDGSPGVAAGRLLPDIQEVEHPASGPAPLHHLVRRTGHTLIVLGGPAADPAEVADLVEALEEAHGDSAAVGAVVGLSTRPPGGAIGRIDPEVTARLEIDGVTVLAVRPDRYVGLRHDGAEPEPVARYLESLAA